MKKRIRPYLCALVISCLFAACSGTAETDGLRELAAQIEEAIPSEYVKQYEMETSHLFTATDNLGHNIEYYVITTTYYGADPEAAPRLHTDAFSTVFDIENTELVKEFDISGHAAAIYREEGLHYICCTTSPTASVVMEYDPDAVSEESAIMTIQSIFE